MNYKHGHATKTGGMTTTYTTWATMMRRCYNSKVDAYKFYGERGIKVCERWHDYRNFLADMGERPEGLTLDRINGAGNYEKDNCRWASHKDNCRHAISVKLTVELVREIKQKLREGKFSQRELAMQYGVSKGTIAHINTGRNWSEVI